MQKPQLSHSQKIRLEEEMAAMEKSELSSDIKEKSHSEILIKARRVPKNINLNLSK